MANKKYVYSFKEAKEAKIGKEILEPNRINSRTGYGLRQFHQSNQAQRKQQALLQFWNLEAIYVC